MKLSSSANCEKSFILKALKENTRFGERNFNQFRAIDIQFQNEWGRVIVSLGATKVLATASCSVKQPKVTRPNEGLLRIDVSFSPVVNLLYDPNKSNDHEIDLSRLLEKCFVESKMLDLESLCIQSGEQVFAIRIDLTVLNHDGNLIDCSSIATLCSLAHFRRPDFALVDGQIRIFAKNERDPIPLHLHHYPLTLTYCLLENGEQIFADPSLLEEMVSSSKIIFALNNYSEICSLFFGGSTQTDIKTIVKYAEMAAKTIEKHINLVKNMVHADIRMRNENKHY